MINTNKLKNWYYNNIGRLLLFFIIVVIVSLTAAYFPYLSFLFTPAARLLIIFLSLYLLFPLSTNKLVFISVVIIFFAFIFSFLELSFISNSLGDFLYLILVFIFVNYLKSIIKRKIDF